MKNHCGTHFLQMSKQMEKTRSLKVDHFQSDCVSSPKIQPDENNTVC